MSSICSDTTTHGVRVCVMPYYVAERSRPDLGQYLFGYRISITNERDDPVQVLSRRWTVIDADGEREEIAGPGVVGQTPVIKPDGTWRYHSYCPLPTPWGTMEGAYDVRDTTGGHFKVAIGRFYLTTDARVAATISL